MSVELSHVLVGTLVLGAIYSLVGIGFVILYRSTGVLNFAQGTFMVAGAYVFYWGLTSMELAWPLALLVSALVMMVLGAAVYIGLFRRLVGSDPLALVIASLGLGVVLQTVMAIVWGPNIRIVPRVLAFDPIHLGWISVTRVDIFVVGIAIAIIVALDLSLNKTRVGVRMRAVADRPLLSAFLGVNVHVMAAAAWAISSVCAGVAGTAYAMRASLDPGGISALGLLAFPAVLLGGLDSIRGALVGGLMLALTQNAASTFIGGKWSDLIAYAVLLAVLLVRPTGLFGKAQIARL
jgi:branched-chain amino acid transport system permease protein